MGSTKYAPPQNHLHPSLQRAGIEKPMRSLELVVGLLLKVQDPYRVHLVLLLLALEPPPLAPSQGHLDLHPLELETALLDH